MKKNVRQKKIPFRQTKKVLTNEDWYPTCQDGTIDVSLLELPISKMTNESGVSVAGAMTTLAWNGTFPPRKRPPEFTTEFVI